MTAEAFLAYAGNLLVQYTAKRALDSAVHQMAQPGSVGALVLRKGVFRQATGHLLSWTRLDRRGSFVKRRNDSTGEYIILYQREPILLGGELRFPYSHCLTLIRDLPSSTDPSALTARQESRFDLDSAIGIQGYKSAAIRFREKKGHKLPFPGSAVRISRWSNHQFELSEADYVDQFVTNQKEIVDETLDNILAGTGLILPRLSGMSLRHAEVEDGHLKSFSSSVLANTIGISATVVTSDGYLIMPRRNKNVHYEPGYEGCSISGVLEWSQGLTTSFMRELEQQLTGKEGPQELALQKTQTTVIPLGFARELQRAGKPQFFFHVWTDTTLEEFKRSWKASKYAADEYDSIRWIRLFESPGLRAPDAAMANATSRILALLNPRATIQLGRQGRIAPNEEVRTNLYYLAVYLGAARGGALPRRWHS